MKRRDSSVGLIPALIFLAGGAGVLAAAPGVGTEEFGMTHKQLVQAVERVEAGISKCMRAQGFEYIAVDYETVRKGMSADKNIPGLSEEDFAAKHGFGIATMYTGLPPQLSTGYSPGKVGLGERNIAVFSKLAPASQAAYNRALFGENTDATFAVGIERENFTRTGGCTREAIKQVFTPEQMAASYYNPKDALINKDPRMKAALRKYAADMRKAGYDYNHPDEVEPDVHTRLTALTRGGTIPVQKMSPEQREALKKLQTFERQIAVKNLQLIERYFNPVEEQIEREMFAK